APGRELGESAGRRPTRRTPYAISRRLDRVLEFGLQPPRRGQERPALTDHGPPLPAEALGESAVLENAAHRRRDAVGRFAHKKAIDSIDHALPEPTFSQGHDRKIASVGLKDRKPEGLKARNLDQELGGAHGFKQLAVRGSLLDLH